MARGLFGGAIKGLDGFGKTINAIILQTLEDVKVRTRTGAFLTMLSAAIILLFGLMETIDYRRVTIDSAVLVDTSRVLSLDITDISGDVRQDMTHNILKTRLSAAGEEIHDNTLNYRIQSEVEHTLKGRPKDYCGSCYGGEEPDGGCCQTCESVRQAYLTRGWSFDDPTMIEQCAAEHWTTYIHEQSSEGCRLSGRVRVNKVTGHFHFSPGRSFLSNRGYVHDLVPYLKDGNHHDFGHFIHEFHFEGEREVEDEWKGGNRGIEWRKKVGLEGHPLDGVEAHVSYDRVSTYDQTKAANWMFQYFMKVVSTEFKHLDGDVVRAHQYSLTNYERDISPGHDSEIERDSHGVRTGHGYEGLPGAFFHFEVSPMMVVHKETRRSFAHFATSLCAVIGGVLTLASIVDSVAFATMDKIESSRGEYQWPEEKTMS
ncbi:hypothetical protein FRC12_006402 [Ceratobasidium sp. 428]|nr:hypothetical protein FRC12_006402 [Ceratobasidium sp. 428]